MFKHTVKFCKVHAETITEVFVGSTDFPEYTRERIKMLSTQNLFCLADNVKYFAGIGVFEWLLKEPWNDIVGLFKAGHVGFLWAGIDKTVACKIPNSLSLSVHG